MWLNPPPPNTPPHRLLWSTRRPAAATLASSLACKPLENLFSTCWRTAVALDRRQPCIWPAPSAQALGIGYVLVVCAVYADF